MSSDEIWSPRSTPPALDAGTVHLWRVDLDVDAAVLDGCRTLLDHGEQRRADRFIGHRQTQRFAVARGTLRRLLGAYLDADPRTITFDYGEHGKPRLPVETPLRFNVSHSGGVALMAFTQGRDLGVDVERTERQVRWDQVASRFFARPELDELMALPTDRRRSGFFRCWTCKEAYMKATGRGITLGLGNFVVRVDPDAPAQLVTVAEGSVADWGIQDVDPGPGTRGALCVEGGIPAVEYYRA